MCTAGIMARRPGATVQGSQSGQPHGEKQCAAKVGSGISKDP
jgi:hypothetical protein